MPSTFAPTTRGVTDAVPSKVNVVCFLRLFIGENGRSNGEECLIGGRSDARRRTTPVPSDYRSSERFGS